MKNYKDKTYRLVSILDREGNRRADVEPLHADFYRNLEGCIARNIREDISFYRDGTFARPGSVFFRSWASRRFAAKWRHDTGLLPYSKEPGNFYLQEAIYGQETTIQPV